MLYHLANYLTPEYGAFNVLTYHTVRAGGALITAFLFCLVLGPAMIRWLRRLKVGQHIKQEHVKDLHALHKGKAGTPTMGGALIIVATLLSLLVWSTLTNRLMLVATAVFLGMGAVGFLDDYLKLRRKHNDGLSAKAKIAGQLLTGALLGLFVVFFPITYGASYLSSTDILDWNGLAKALGAECKAPGPTGLASFAKSLSPDLRGLLAAGELDAAAKNALLRELNQTLQRNDLYHPGQWDPRRLNGEGRAFLAKGLQRLNSREQVRFNRILFEAAAHPYVKTSPRHLNTSVGVPGFKDWLIPMGGFYVLFVIIIIIGASNAVNLTDGLDGLAAGASIVAVLAFSGIAYVISRADWSDYLYVLHVPEASELTVVGGALLGAGLGFLWFNAHPAEVFMGDTGSLALGGVIGAFAILTKQELLLPIVGGLFVIEALSVILQVGSYKLRGKRVFRMAPLHHHFELAGWSESKVTIRFWILALLFALLSLSTLKLR